MTTGQYTARIRQCIERCPELVSCLERVVAAWRRNPDRLPRQITLCVAGAISPFELEHLFSPGSVKRRGASQVLMPEKMTDSRIELEIWLRDAAEVCGTPADAGKQYDSADILCARLAMLFPTLDSALESLRQQPGNIKRKITEAGFDQAVEHYRLCLTATQFLKNNTRAMSAADLGVTVCNNSKAFRPDTSRYHCASRLLAAEIGGDAQTAMAVCGVTENPTAVAVTVFGPFVCYQSGQPRHWIRQLWESGEAATLNFGNIEKLERIALEAGTAMPVVSCENESPFNAMMRNAESTALVYTAGYPNSAVKRFISLLDREIEYYHWGDTDPDGLAIAAGLNTIKGLRLYRCDLATCQRLRDRLKPLDAAKQDRARKMLAAADMPFSEELGFAIEHGWLEQESWIAEPETRNSRREIRNKSEFQNRKF